MIFATHKDPLLKALDRISSIVKANPRTVDILQTVLVDSYGGDVYLTATSPMANAKVEVKGAKVGASGAFVVNYDKFRDRVSKSGDTMRLEADETTLKIISSDDQRLGIPLNDIREFPEITWEFPEESYGMQSEDLIALLRTANSLTSSVTSLTPAFLQVMIKDRQLWAANNVSYHKIPISCNPSLESRIPTATLTSIVKFIQDSGGDQVWLSHINESHVVITSGADQFQATPISAPFPDLTELFKQTAVRATSDLKVDRKRLISELTKAKTSADTYGRVTITIPDTALTSMVVETQSEGGDWYEGTVPGCLWTGSAGRNLVFNIDTLLSYLRSFSGEELVLQVGDDFKGDLTPLMCKEGEHVGIINQFRI